MGRETYRKQHITYLQMRDVIIVCIYKGVCVCGCVTKKLAQPADTCHKVMEGHVKLSRCKPLRQQLNHLAITL